MNEEPATGNRQVAAGIVKHPETQLWQIWAILDGPCVFLGAYADPVVAQKGLKHLSISQGEVGREPKLLRSIECCSHGVMVNQSSFLSIC